MMGELVGIIAILCFFGSPVAIIWAVMHFRHRDKLLKLEETRRPWAGQLEVAEREKKQLEARIQNLETIVCSVDFELNQRLNRLAAGVSGALPALPAGTPGRGRAAFDATMAQTGPVPSGGMPSNGGTGFGDRIYAMGYLEPGRVVLGRYRVERELGRGGMGAVYLANDSKLGEQVALKVISSALAGDPEQAVARFHREVQASRRVTHPNVVRIHDLGEEGPLLFLSMEYVEGETLAARIRRGGALPIAEAARVIGEVTRGVAAAHTAGVVHRDLKPQNVLLGPGGGVKVIDFGLATTSFFAGMTATGMILGTPEYMAPEQIKGGTMDARVDVYALGALAYHVLCGRPPFVGETPIAVGFAHMNETPRSPRELRAEIPAVMEAAVLKALSKAPAERFVDAAAFDRAFAAAGDGALQQSAVGASVSRST
jgi:serine/threonine-protein kinase